MTATVVMTIAGKTALASAVQGFGTYNPPLYLVLEGNGSTFHQGVAAGVSSIVSNAPVHLSGDSQIVLGVGLPTQEVVTFISPAPTTSPATYVLAAPTVFAHTSGDPICRLPLVTDSMSRVQSELQYDAANAPGLRVQSVSGYSTGDGQWTMQFYLTGIQASAFLMMVGISDSPLVGQGTLHAHMVLGVNHVYVPANGGVDLEIDIPISLT